MEVQIKLTWVLLFLHYLVGLVGLKVILNEKMTLLAVDACEWWNGRCVTVCQKCQLVRGHVVAVHCHRRVQSTVVCVPMALTVRLWSRLTMVAGLTYRVHCGFLKWTLPASPCVSPSSTSRKWPLLAGSCCALCVVVVEAVLVFSAAEPVAILRSMCLVPFALVWVSVRHHQMMMWLCSVMYIHHRWVALRRSIASTLLVKLWVSCTALGLLCQCPSSLLQGTHWLL